MMLRTGYHPLVILRTYLRDYSLIRSFYNSRSYLMETSNWKKRKTRFRFSYILQLVVSETLEDSVSILLYFTVSSL